MRAGADVIETNTFGANRIKLRAFGLGRTGPAINCRARGSRVTPRASRRSSRARSARSASASSRGARPAWTRRRSTSGEQAAALLEGGVDLFVLETFRDSTRSAPRSRGAQRVRSADRRADDDGGRRQQPRRHAARSVRARSWSTGRRRRRRQLQRRSGGDARDHRAHGARRSPCTLSAQPNAGRPREIEGRNIYLWSPEYMASYARRFIGNGVRLVGGCCGTTPEHIRQIKGRAGAAPTGAARGDARAARRSQRRGLRRCAVAPVARGEKSRLANALARGEFVVSVELLPPQGYRRRDARRAGAQLRIHGVDVVNIPDGPARARA